MLNLERNSLQEIKGEQAEGLEKSPLEWSRMSFSPWTADLHPSSFAFHPQGDAAELMRSPTNTSKLSLQQLPQIESECGFSGFVVFSFHEKTS